MSIEENQVEDLNAKLEAELEAFEAAERTRLGLDRKQYTENINTHFVASQRAHTTILVSGLSLAHDEFGTAALRGLGYRSEIIDVPDNAALQFGKEFGNRGQCSPTYFTVGNLVKHLIMLRDDQGIPTEEIISKFVFVTAGACGPCRFGTYVTEYRKALRDSGFDGFRVLLFQQQGGIKQATGEEVGLKIDAKFGLCIVRAFIAGDVLNLMGYRMRPYEVVPGSTMKALDECKQILIGTLENTGSVVKAMLKCRRILAKVEVDYSQPKPLVSLIGEFWAMTTEGDGNYKMQAFLEEEGAEVDIQGLTNWILFMIWENTFDTKKRMTLRVDDKDSKKALEGTDPQKKLLALVALDKAVRAAFQTYAHALGLYRYDLPDMDQIRECANGMYNEMVRGGEAHMEIGKAVHFVEDKINHMTLSVKPFGCMPSSGVSDGVQAAVQSKFPESIFLPIETTGDGAVNVYSRVQMMLFKARQKARKEFEQALAQSGMTEEEFKKRLAKSRRFRGNFARPRHVEAGNATNLVYALA